MGVTGVLSAANSLVGSTANDNVGNFVTALNNGNYVVGSPNWNNGAVVDAGAVTWGSGANGVTGAVSAANSLVGSTANDNVGNFVTALNNGNYVVGSPNWNNGAVVDAGAVTWGSGANGVTGAVSAANSLVGSTANDQVGYYNRVTALNNGNFVVSSPNWDNGTAVDAGAVTWGSGTMGVTGVVSATNSLVGSIASDSVGNGGATVLNNGNYLVCSPNWDSGGATNVGAVTWGSGTMGVTGAVSAANSLFGSIASDSVGNGGATALNNGNYVVRSTSWNGGRGAVTWGSGTSGATGAVSAANSLVGSTANDQVGSRYVAALNNGNYYVVGSPKWNNGAVTNAGAVTWGSGTTGMTGVVSAANSLVGSTANDQVGYPAVTALNNGNFVASSLYWNGSRGAVTWGSGTTGVSGVLSAANSLVGSTANDQVGNYGVTALNNGNYAVSSVGWDNGAVVDAGAVTWGSGTIGVTGAVSAVNSLVGSTANDMVGYYYVTALANGNYVVSCQRWDNGAVTDAGAVTWGDGILGTAGEVTPANSVLGNTTNGGSSMVFAYDYLNARLIVGYAANNHVSLFSYTPKIVLEQPLNVNLTNRSTIIFGAPVGTNDNLTFIIKNTAVGDLTGLGITIDGAAQARFTVVTDPVAPVSGPFGSTSFTVRFVPAIAGWKTANLHITSNDPDESPFTIHLSGNGLASNQDTDSDGISDTAEFYLSALGFDWQVSQPSLVNSLYANASGAGLYTTNQIQALNVGTPLLAKDPLSGLFTLTIGVQKSTNLVDFSPFPMTAPQTMINGLGELEFQFSAPDNAAFFRLESR
jgi:hypothetical protein